MDLKDKAVIVTGASQGIGAALSLALARQGARVACAARSETGLGKTLAAIESAGARAIAVVADVTKEDDLKRVVARTAEAFGAVDALVNNAGLYGTQTRLESDITQIKYEMEVNFFGPLYGIRAALPHLRESKGMILNVSSAAALNVLSAQMAYGVSKLALERLTLDAAAELKADGVSCNCLRIDVGVVPADYDPAALGFDEASVRHIRQRMIYFEPLETGASAMIYMLTREAEYTGKIESLRDLIVRKAVRGQAKELVPLERWSRWSW